MGTQSDEQSIVSDHVLSADFQQTFSKHWLAWCDYKDDNLEIITKPFRICRIRNFIRGNVFLEKLKGELISLKHKRRILDLHQFEQSCDLKYVGSNYIEKVCKTFRNDLTWWMERNTKITLNGKVSLSSSSYAYTDHLLCHDDNMDDRRIAFILYLSEWTLEDGGTLDMFDTDEDNRPRQVVRSLVPEYNSLVFFEVVDNSYHQVAEVTSREKFRWSVNGWFHGPIIPSQRLPKTVAVNNLEETNGKQVTLNSWISKKYLIPNIIEDIQREVETNSYVYLREFLKVDMYTQLSIDLKSEEINWRMAGPADERHYEIADEQTLPQLLKDFCDIFRSISIFQLLKGYTDLDLVATNGNMKPKMMIELQRWSQGCYTLLVDRSINNDSFDDLKNDVWASDDLDSDEEDVELPPKKDKLKNTKCFIPQLETSEEETRSSDTAGQSSKYREYDELGDAITVDKSVALKRKNSNVGPSPGHSANEIKKFHYDSPGGESGELTDVEDNLLSNSDPDTSVDKEDKENVQEAENENEGEDDDTSDITGASLDLIMQFHTAKAKYLDETIDYVDPRDQKGELIHVPAKDNHLCLVYKAADICRFHHYVNNYCKGYFYNLICTYYE